MARQRARLSAGQARAKKRARRAAAKRGTKKRAPLSPAEAKATRNLGLRVRELRRERGWTQQDAADRLEIALVNYAHVEQGRRLVRIDTLVNLANLFGVTIADLFAEPEDTIVRPGRPPRERE